jgi:alkylation response protein AidB-like acyl-CoA dehydrogenase
MGGITLFLVHRSMEGFQTRPIHCQGNIGSGTAFIVMENVKVPATSIVGLENKGFKAIMFNFNHERLGIIVGSLRSARVCYEEALTYGNL